MRRSRLKFEVIVLAAVSLWSGSGSAVETLSLAQALERATANDPRINERTHLVDVARATLQQAEGSKGWMIDANTFVGVTSSIDGGFFEGEGCQPGNCVVRSDRFSPNSFSPWFSLNFSLIKPLNTFGKIENYSEAARGNIVVKQNDVVIQRAATRLDVYRAYYGYLAARDSRLLLQDVKNRLQSAMETVQGWLDEEEGSVKQSDLFALQSGNALAARYLAQAEGLANVAMSGLKTLTGVGAEQELALADERLVPVPLPELKLEEMQQQALVNRPEITQVEAGLRSRRALVEAKKSEHWPSLYAGVVGTFARSPNRAHLDNPYIPDIFNDYGVTPIVGLRWDWDPAVQQSKVAEAQAELEALVAKSEFARRGIPFEVSEQYYQVQSYHQAVEQLEEATRSARRWMVASYTDFEAGVEKPEKILTALQAYVLAHTDYVRTVYDYNMHVAKLENVAGTIP